MVANFVPFYKKSLEEHIMGFGIEGLVNKRILEDTSEQGPSLASHDGRLFIAWKGSGNDNLNVAPVGLFSNWCNF